MNKILSVSMTCVFIFGAFLACTAQTRSITVSGTIVDSATGLPVPQAMVLMHADTIIDTSNLNFGSLKLDTVFTGTKGTFQHQMTINNQSFLLYYGVLKLGYRIKYNFSLILFSTISLSTIKISKMDTSVKDTITVSGTAVDSATGAGIGGALVIMSSGGGFDTTGNNALTNANGTFSKQVIISKLNGASIVSYIITNQNYQTKLGQNTATGKQLDLGRIIMTRTNVAVRQTGISFAPSQASRMRVYSLNGRLLYQGRALPLDKTLQSRGAAVIVSLTNKNSTVGMKKMLLQR